MMFNKKGQGLSINAIILIVLGVVVLALLIAGFSIGWNKILPFLSTDSTGTIVTSCQIACSSGNEYDFCSAPRDLKAGDVELKSVTCDYLAKNQTQYGVDVCPTESCPNFIYVANAEGPTLLSLGSLCEKTDSGQRSYEGVTFKYLKDNRELTTIGTCTDGVLPVSSN